MRRLIPMFVLLTIFAFPVFAQDATSAPDIPPEMAAQMDRLETFTEAARQLDELNDVPRDFPSRDDVRVYLEELYSDALALEDLARAETLYKALWLLPREIDLRATYLTLLGSQIGGFYDTDTQIMNVIPSFGETGSQLSLTEQIIYVHEFTHALQDQHFALDGLMNDPEVADVPDRSLALLSLIEGDASAVMNLYTAQVSAINPGSSLQLLAEGAMAGNLLLPPDIPAILGRELGFPYENGLAFVLELWRDGGWGRVNEAFSHPPTTSEQILHPDKYLAGEGAIAVEFEDIGSALGEGWTEVWAIPLGEFYLREHLRAGGLSSREASDAAAGWGGDFLRVYERDGTYAWMLQIAWDTPADADEFTAAYEELATERYGTERVEGCWRNDEASLCLSEIDGSHTIQYVEVR